MPGQTDDLAFASIIIASRDRPGLLADCVESILHGRSVPAELIVIDQSVRPHPTLSDSVERGGCRLRYMQSEPRGVSHANNLGARVARHDLLVYTHDDVLVEPDWYSAMVRSLVRHGPQSVISGRVLPGEPNQGDGFALSTNTSSVPAVYEGRTRRDVLYPLNMALHRSALEAVDGFDERLGPGTPYPAAEDNDLGHRLLDAGYRIVFEPDAVVLHRAWRPRAELVRLRYSYGRGQGAFYAKHLDWRDRYMLRRLAEDLVGSVYGLGGGFRARGRSRREEAAYLSGLVTGGGKWFRTERRRS